MTRIYRSPFRIVFVYTIVSLTYIYFSDALLSIFIRNGEQQARLQTAKGFGFVIITAALLYFLIRRNVRVVTENQRETAIVNHKLMTAQQIAKMGHWSHNLDNGAVYWSDEMYRIYDVDPTHFTLTADNMIAHVHPDDRHIFTSDVDKYFTDDVRDVEHRIITASGHTRWVAERTRLFRGTALQPSRLEGVLVDVTENHERIRKIEAQNETLREIAWTQSHVIRAPLANLIGLVDLLRVDRDHSLQDRELVDDIARSASKLDNVIRNIVSKTETMELK